MSVGVHQHICRSVSCGTLNGLHIAAGNHQLIGGTGMPQTMEHDTRELRVGMVHLIVLDPLYTGNFAGRMKKRQNCNGKRKMSSRATDLQQLLFIKKILSPSDETHSRGMKTPKTGRF